jgi:short subunit fatty acids transporter
VSDSPYFELVIAAVAGLGTGLGLIAGAVIARELLRRTTDLDRDQDGT